MQKYKAKKEVIEQVTSKLQANKNIFARGDFDEYKITDEELMECQEDIDKSYTKREFVSGNGKRQSYWRTRTYDGIKGRTNNYNSNKRTEVKGITELKSHISNLRNKQSLTEKNEVLKKYAECTDVIRINNVDIKVHPSRNPQNLNKQERKKVYRELTTVSKLSKHGFDVALTKEVAGNKNFDFIINGVLYELKNTKGTNLNSIEHRYGEALEQSSNVIMCFDNKENMLPHFREFHLMKKARNTEKEHTSIIIMFKDSDDVYFYDFGQKKGSTEVPPSSTSITKNKNKSSNINKSLTYSGYKLQGRTKLYGMDISIENKKGSYRSGVDSDGHKWKCLMHYDYGYIRGTVGVDSDHVDVYVGPDKEAQKVYVIHQNNPVTHKYDEDKCMLCFSTKEDAKKAYMKQYDRLGFYGSMDILTIDEFKSFVFSKQGKMVHKSFDITISDITENNKQQKVEQVEKALNQMYLGNPFVIKHIKADKKSKKYDDIVMRISNFDKNKIEKAVHSLAFTLDTKVNAAKGEAFNYKSQEDLTNKFVNELTEKTKELYNFVIGYFGLPEITVVSKANLTYKGKVIYNSETGEPIKKADWDKFVKALESFLNRNYKGVGERIVLSSETLGRILERMSKTHSLEEVKKVKLSDISYQHRTFDWISQSSKNMQDTFGDSVSRWQAARIEVAAHSAAIKVTKVKDIMRNDIQDIIIDGIVNRESKSKVSQKLFDKCVGLNRDFQRIADTEIQNNVNNAYLKEEVYNTPEGEKVYFKRFEILDDNTCKKCKKIKGQIALWSDVALPDEHIKDEYAKYAIWEGKEDGDMPSGVSHPYCRGSWFRYYPELD